MSSTVAPPSLTITSVSSGSGLTTVTTINTAGQLPLQAQHESTNSVVVPTVSVKQERHDEAEIQEMANKFREAQKAAMAKQTQQQQQVLMKQNSAAVPGAVVAQANGQTNILSYLTRRSPQTVMGQAGAIPTAAIGSNGQVQAVGAVANGKPAAMVTATAIGVPTTSIETNGDKKTCDEESQKGHFGWVTFGKIYIPYIVRQNEKYCAVRMVEMKLLNKYLSYLHPDIYSSCTCVRSYYITEAESRLLNEINHKHCDAQFGREMFTLKDLVVRLSDANKFYQFLDICYRKLVTGSKSPSDKCGFIRINKESVVPYTVRATEQVVPLFYFEGETDNLRQKAELLSGWDLAYLKFCCKVQGIRNELFSSESVAVISLTDIKSYFPTGTEFEDYWPSKVVDSNLLIASKNLNNSVHWTRQPTAPPVTPKILNALPKGVQQQQQQQQQQQIRKNAYQTPVPQQNTLQSKRHTAATSMAILTGLPPTDPNIQAWSMAYAQGALRTGDTITQNDNQQQQQVQRGYANVHNAAANAQNLQNLQNLMTARQQYNYNPRGMPIPTIVNNCNQTAQPPPLVRSAVQQQQHVLNFSSGQHSPLERSDYQHYHNHQNLNIHLPDPHSMTSPQPIDQRSSAIYQLLSPPSVSLSSCEPTNKTPTKSYLPDESRDSRYGHAMISSYPCDGPPGIVIPNVSPARASPKQLLRTTPEHSKLAPPPLIPMPPMHSSTSGENKLPEAANVPTQEQLDVAIEKLKLIDGLSSFVRPSTISSFLSLLTGTQAASPSSKATNFLTYPYSDLLPTTPTKASSESVSLPTIRNIACNNPVTSAPASSTTMEVIDLSSPRRSTAAAAANVVMQQQQQQHQQQQRHQQQLQLQQQQQQHQQQQQQMQQRLNTMQNGRSNPATSSNTMQRHATNAAMPVVADVSDVSLRVIPEITSQSTTGHVPYKMQKVFVFDDTLVPCINMKAYNDSDPLMTLMDFREYFFPNVSWQQCKRLLEALGVEMYRGNRRQTMTLIECGKNHNESIPLIQVRDVIKYMPQLRYMMRSSQIGQEQPPNKRTRIS